MKVLSVEQVGTNFVYSWPDGKEERFPFYIMYLAEFEQGRFTIRVGYTRRRAYGRERARIVTWINGYPFAEFIGADNFEDTGELLSEIKLKKGKSRLICKYPKDPVPPRYSMFNVQGMPMRISGKGVHGAWAVVANICDHKAICSFAAMRQFEKDYY